MSSNGPTESPFKRMAESLSETVYVEQAFVMYVHGNASTKAVSCQHLRASSSRFTGNSSQYRAVWASASELCTAYV